MDNFTSLRKAKEILVAIKSIYLITTQFFVTFASYKLSWRNVINLRRLAAQQTTFR